MLGTSPDAVASGAFAHPTKSSQLRLDRQQLPQIGGQPPAKAGVRLVAVAHRRAVLDRLPDQPALGREAHAKTVGGRHAARHPVGQLPCELGALDIEAGLGVDRSRARVEVEAADEYRLSVERPSPWRAGPPASGPRAATSLAGTHRCRRAIHIAPCRSRSAPASGRSRNAPAACRSTPASWSAPAREYCARAAP